MPSTPYAKLLVSLNAGPTQSGGVTALNGNTVQFTAESTAQWDLTVPPRWEIYAYPPGWTGPAAGWTTESVPSPFGGTYDVYVYIGLGPPPAFALPALPMWGDFLCKLTVAGGLLNGLPAAQLVDNATALRIVGPGGLKDIAVSAEAQFDTARAWVGSWQDSLRILDAAVVGAATPYAALPAPVQIGLGSAGAVLQYSKGDHSHPVTIGTPTTITVGAAAASGGGVTLAGAAHVHALPVPTVINNVSSGASSLGASTAVAREDHSHQLTFATLNTILGTASAPITVNGQTLTSGGFIGPYFQSNAANPATSGLLRGVHNSVLVASRDNANVGNVPLISYGVDGLDILTLGDATVPCMNLRIASGCDFNFYHDTDLLLTIAQNSLSIGATNTFLLTQTTGAGAGGTATIRAQGGAATFSGGNLIFQSGAKGAGGTTDGDIGLDANDGTIALTADTLEVHSSAVQALTYTRVGGFVFEDGASASMTWAASAAVAGANTTIDAQGGATQGGMLLLSAGSSATSPGVMRLRTYAPAGTSGEIQFYAAGAQYMGIINTGSQTTISSTDTLVAETDVTVTIAPLLSAGTAADVRAPDRAASITTTTDATVTTALTYAVPNNCVAFFDVAVVVYCPADGTSAIYKIKAGVKRFSAGVATLIGTVDVFAREDNAALDATLDVDGGNNARIRVTGIAATTFKWFVTTDVTLMQP